MLTHFVVHGRSGPKEPGEFLHARNHRVPRRRPDLHTAQYPLANMTSTKIELNVGRISRIQDLADLAEMLFPGNRNQQHAFLVIWSTIKWSRDGLVPDLSRAIGEAVSRRTYERVRAKMRRLGLIDHVSRFGTRHGYREGWVLSSRCERGLSVLAQRLTVMRDRDAGSQAKELLLIDYLAPTGKSSSRLGPSHNPASRKNQRGETCPTT